MTGSAPVVIEIPGATSTDSAAVAVAPAASVRVAMKPMVVGAVAVGTPVKTPAGVSVSPEPASPVALHVNGLVPPVRFNGYEYGWPRAAAGRIWAGIAGSGLIPKIHTPENTCPKESVSVTVNEAGLAEVGVPAITPVLEFNSRPAGSDPLVTNQLVYGGVPPITVRVAE